MTQPRRIVPGAFYMITRRVTQRMYLLRPERVVNELFEYCIADAAQRTGVKLIAWCAMSNHYHAVLYDPDGKVPEFCEHFHKMMAKPLNLLRKRRENVWSTEETCVTRLVDINDVFDKVVYVLSNPAKADLVESIVHWPGSSSWYRMGQKRVSVRRPRLHFRSDGVMPETAELHVVAPPGLKGETPAEWIARVRREVDLAESELRRKRLKEATPLVGRKQVLATKPADAPTTKAPRSKLRPALACKDKERMKKARAELRGFRVAYRRVLLRLRAGMSGVEFPVGTYRLRQLGLRCAPFRDTATVCT
jgi:putative transposase